MEEAWDEFNQTVKNTSDAVRDLSKAMSETMGEPLWDDETRSRKHGSTTFETCGWCVYTSTGTWKYDCCLDGCCNLLSSYHPNCDVKWGTKCFIKNLGQKDIEDFIRSKECQIVSERKAIARTESEIQILKELTVDDCPPLPHNRECDHFNIGDRVMNYAAKKMFAEHCCLRLGWISGTVVDGYRHHDGCVSFIADEPFHANYEYEQGKGSGSGVSIPFILLESEYKWFASHPDRFLPWLKLACVHDFNGLKIVPESVETPHV